MGGVIDGQFSGWHRNERFLLHRLGEAKLKDPALVLELWREALRLAPDDAVARERLEQLSAGGEEE